MGGSSLARLLQPGPAPTCVDDTPALPHPRLHAQDRPVAAIHGQKVKAGGGEALGLVAAGGVGRLAAQGRVVCVLVCGYPLLRW